MASSSHIGVSVMPRAEAVHADAVRDQLERKRPREVDHRALARAVRGEVRLARDPGLGSHRHDRSASALLHVRDGGPHREPRSLQVDVEDVIPERLVEVLDRGDARDPRVAEEIVEPVPVLDRLSDHAIDVGALRDIADDRANRSDPLELGDAPSRAGRRRDP